MQPDGAGLIIPAGALTSSVPVTIATLPETSVSTLVGSDFRLLRAIDLTITGQTLKSSATLSIPAPQGFDPALPVIVAKKFDTNGVSRLKLVSLATQSGTLISSTPLPSELNNSTTQLTSSGTYLFLQAAAPIGYLTGQVTDSANAPFSGILTTVQGATMADKTAIDGRYLLALAAGDRTVTALDQARGDFAQGTGTVTANSKTTLDLKVVMIPPQVVAITPANGATNVQPTVPVVITFSKTMDKSTITNTTLVVRDAANNAAPGVLTFSVDSKEVTFYPSDAFKQETAYSVTIAATVKDVQGYPLGQDIVSSFTVRKTTPPAMPPAGSVSATFPDADGFITITATQGTAPADCTVLLINDTTGEIVSVSPQTNGSFTGRARGQLGDEIKVVIMDYSGNQTLVSYITFKSDDGRYLVTAKGGKVEGEGGSLLEISEGALVGPAVIKVTALPEANLPHPVPAEARFIGGVNVDNGGLPFNKEVHLSIPIPADLPAGVVPFLARPSNLTNADGTQEQVYEIIDSTKIINNRITTASPPFDGVMEAGSYVFLYATGSVIGDVIISGTAYRDMDGLPGYDKTVDKPVQGAVIRSPQANNFVSYSKADGHYATFGFAVNGSCRNFPITAIHPQTMYRTSVNISTCDVPYIVNNLNFRLADKDTVLPDKTPPVIDLNLAIAPGQADNLRIIAGTVYIGTVMNLPLIITDQLMGSATLTVSFIPQGGGSALAIPATLAVSGQGQVTTQSGVLTRYTYTPSFPADIAGNSGNQFKPKLEGIYSFVVEAKDASENKSSRSISIRAIPEGTSLGSGKEGLPTVDSVVPSDKATDVMITVPVIAWFSEPVDNVNDTTFVLLDSTTGMKVPATVSSGLEAGRMQATLTPKGNLYYGRKYEIRLTNAITDAYPNADGNKHNLPSFSATFSTKIPKGYDLTDTPFAGRDIDLYTFTNTSSETSTYAYLTAGAQGWRIANVTDPTVPVTLYPADGKTFPYGFDYRNLAINQDKGVMAMTENITYADGNQYGYVRFYNLYTNPADPPIVGREKLAEAYSGIPGRVAMMGDYAYISTINAGLQVVDINQAISNQNNGQSSDGSSIAGVFDSVGQGFGQPNDIAVYGANKALLTTTSGNLLALDVSIPLPQLMSQYQDISHHPLRIGIAPEYSYLNSFGVQEVKDIGIAGTREGKVITIDFTDPYNPATMAVAKNENGNDLVTIIREISVNKEAGLVFITTNGSIQVIDIKDPTSPRLLSTISQLPDKDGVLTTLGQIPAIVEKGGWVYLASQNKGLTVVDLDPALITITAPAIRIDKPIRGNARDALVPITYRVFEFGDFSPYSANMYIYANSKVIAQFINIPHKGTNTINFPAQALGIEFDVRNRYEVEVSFSEKILFGSMSLPSSKKVRMPLEWQAIATDYNRDGKIDAVDLAVADTGKPHYFWVNDNADIDDTEGNSIPGSGSDWRKGNVSGTRDLIDYFPVHLDIAALLTALPPQPYKYILKQGDTAVSFVYTNQRSAQAKEYLTNVDTARSIGGIGNGLQGAPKYQATRAGATIAPSILQSIQQNGSALFLADGRTKTVQPLVLEVWDKSKNDVAFRTQMSLSIDSVEQMFRHKNLIQMTGGPAPDSGDGGVADRLSEPKNFPDSETNGKTFLLHFPPNFGGMSYVTTLIYVIVL